MTGETSSTGYAATILLSIFDNKQMRLRQLSLRKEISRMHLHLVKDHHYFVVTTSLFSVASFQ